MSLAKGIPTSLAATPLVDASQIVTLPWARWFAQLLTQAAKTGDFPTWAQVQDRPGILVDIGGIGSTPTTNGALSVQSGIWQIVDYLTPAEADSVYLSQTSFASTLAALEAEISGKEPAIAAGTASQYWRGDKTFQDFATAARAAFVAGAGIAIDYGTGVISATGGGGGGYVLPVATASVLGGVKDGAGVSVDLSGVLSADVRSVFGRVGAITAQSGDYTASQVGAEPTLSNPPVTGYVLASTTGGVRSWVQQFASADVLATVLSGFASGGDTVLNSGNTVLVGLQNLQGQISALSTHYQPLENQRLSTTNSPTFAGLTLVNASWEQPIARTTSGTAGAGWQIEDPSQKWSFQIRQDGLSGSTAHSWSIDDITANVLRVWGNATRTVFKTEVNVDGQISEGGAYLNAKYLGILSNAVSASKWNSPITISASLDLSYITPSIDGSGSVTAAATVVGLRGHGLPAPTAAGNLRWNGSALLWDGTSYAENGGAASFSAIAITGLSQYVLPRVVDLAGTFGASAISDNGSEVDISRPVKAMGSGSDTAGSGIFAGVFDPVNFKGGFIQRSASDNLDVWTGNVGATTWQRVARFATDRSSTFYGTALAPAFASVNGRIKGESTPPGFTGDTMEIAASGTLSSVLARKYSSGFGSVLAEANLLDSSGNTSFPGTVSAANFTVGGVGFLPLTGGTLTGDLHGPFGDLTAVDTRQLTIFPASTPPGDRGDRMWTWDAYGNYNDNTATLRLQRSIGGSTTTPPELLVAWNGSATFGYPTLSPMFETPAGTGTYAPAPAGGYASRSTGTRFLLDPTFAVGTAADVAIGVDTNGIWYQTKNPSAYQLWTIGPSQALRLTNGVLDLAGVYKVSGTQVVGARNTGWSAITGTAEKGGLNADAAFWTDVGGKDISELPKTIKALYDAMLAHGLIGA